MQKAYRVSSKPLRSARLQFSPNLSRTHGLCTRSNKRLHASNPKLKYQREKTIITNGTGGHRNLRSRNERSWFPYLENDQLIPRDGEYAGFRCSNQNRRTKDKSGDGLNTFHIRGNNTSWP